MNEKKKLELLDQYDDVTFALLMDEYAEEEGARLRREFEDAQAAGEVTDPPDALDEKCLQMIHRDFARKRGKENVRKIIRMTSKVAVAVMVFLGIAATTIMSVDALRIPVLSYLVEHFGEYSSIDFSGQAEMESLGATQNPLLDLLPEGYFEVFYEENDGLISSMYENDERNYILFSMTSATGEYWFDSEGATCTNVVLGNCEAILIEEERLQMIWVDEDSQIIYNFVSDGLDKTSFWNICESLALHYENDAQ